MNEIDLEKCKFIEKLTAKVSELEAQLRQEREANEKLREEIKSGDEMYEAQQQKYADCPHKPISGEVNECGCSFDKIGDVCAYHAPALKAAQATIGQLQDDVAHIEMDRDIARQQRDDARATIGQLRRLKIGLEDSQNELAKELTNSRKEVEMQDDKVFWAEVYLQCIRNGNPHDVAVTNANGAVSERKKA